MGPLIRLSAPCLVTILVLSALPPCRAEERSLEGHTQGVNCVAISPDDRLVASGSEDLTVRLWEMSSCEPLRVLEGHAQPIQSVAWSPDGKCLASGAGSWKTVDTAGEVKIWSAEGDLVCSVEGTVGPVYAVQFTPDGKRLAIGTWKGKTGVVRFWEVDSKKMSESTIEHPCEIRALAFTPKGDALLIGGQDGTLAIWNASDWSKRWSGKCHSGTIAALLVVGRNDGATFITGSGGPGSGEYAVRRTSDGSGRASFPVRGYVGALAFATRSGVLAVGSGKEILLRVGKDGAVGPTLKGHSGPVNDLSFSSDGKTLASASGDSTVRLWPISESEGK